MNKERNHKELYENCIWNTLQLTAVYSGYIKNNDLAGLNEVKGLLKAERVVLGNIYSNANHLYMQAKHKYNDAKDEKYLKYRESNSQGDAEKMARLECRDLRKEMDDIKLSKDKTYRMMKDTKEVVIECSIRLREAEDRVKYG